MSGLFLGFLLFCVVIMILDEKRGDGLKHLKELEED